MILKWKAAIVAEFRYNPGLCLGKLGKTTRSFTKNIHYPDRDQKP
jgi:hypothetical protein